MSTGPTAMGTGKCRCVPMKTNKAALTRGLEKNVSPADVNPTPSTCMIDGIWYKTMNGNKKQNVHNWQSVLSIVLYVGGQGGKVVVVFDVYRQPSIMQIF